MFNGWVAFVGDIPCLDTFPKPAELAVVVVWCWFTQSCNIREPDTRKHSAVFSFVTVYDWTPCCVITGQFTCVCTACFSNDLQVYNFSMHVAECVGMIANVGMKKDPD